MINRMLAPRLVLPPHALMASTMVLEIEMSRGLKNPKRILKQEASPSSDARAVVSRVTPGPLFWPVVRQTQKIFPQQTDGLATLNTRLVAWYKNITEVVGVRDTSG